MVVMAPREKWSDERLDDLNKKVDDGFARVDWELKDLRREMDARFDRMDARFDKVEGKVDARFDKVDARLADMESSSRAMNRILIASAATIVAALIGVNAF